MGINTQAEIELTAQQLLQVRKQYFYNYLERPDEFLNKDYQLICSKCKQKRYFQSNNFVRVCLCTCQANKLNEQQRLEKLEKQKELCGLGKLYRNLNFNNIDTNRPDDFLKAYKLCKKYCDNWQFVKSRGLGMYLYGDIGTGKSLLTACVCNYLLEKNVKVIFTSFIEIAKIIKQTFTNSLLSERDVVIRYAIADLLIIDDIGTEIFVKNQDETWIQDKIFDIINERYVRRLPILFTSNNSLRQLVEERGLRKKIVDRIAVMSAFVIKLQGVSYRLQQHQANKNLFLRGDDND